MPPKKKKTKFQMQWLSEPIDGYPANTWLSQNPNNPEEAICMVCIPNKDRAQGKVFSVAEGFTAVTRHAAGEKHKVRKFPTLSVLNWNKM